MELVKFYRYGTHLGMKVVLFDYRGNRYLIDNKVVWPVNEHIRDEFIGEYDIEIAKFILRLYGKNV